MNQHDCELFLIESVYLDFDRDVSRGVAREAVSDLVDVVLCSFDQLGTVLDRDDLPDWAVHPFVSASSGYAAAVVQALA